jgi:predicted acyltransferase
VIAPAVADPAPAGPRPARLLSLDVFRGATIALMILVNDAGDWGKTYAPLLHAEWHGWTPTDLVFPFFLFIVGVSIAVSLGARRDAAPRGALERKVWRRAAILFLLGLALIWFPYYTVTWSRARIPGVLQRIAVVYLVTALAYLRLGARARAILATALLLAYGAVLAWVPSPGGVAGDLSPQGNVAFALDHRVLGAHIWRYSPGPGDPEGILSTLGAIVSGLAGLFVGDALRGERDRRTLLRDFLGAGLVLALAGWLLGWLQPINKNLWTPAYVLFTTGAALLVFAPLHAALDTRPRPPAWTRPFAIFGLNSILAYVGSGVLARILGVVKLPDVSAPAGTITLQKWIYARAFVPYLPDYVASLAWALAHVLVWLAVLAWLDRRRIYLKV